MELSAHILALASLVFFAALCVRYFTHMFQLNSYTASVQFRWMRENRLRLVPCAILLAASLACAFVKRPVYGYLFFAAAALLTALFYLPKKAKKPLVYTARVKRLLVTCGLFTLLFAAIGVLLGGSGEFLLLGIVFAALPFILILANRVNAPMEKAIRDHYIRDAKKMLAAHDRLRIIGVTGSFGKTSVKYFLTALLRVRYNVLMTPESYNTPMGVVKTIRSSLRSTHDIFVCEMGAKYVGDIKELCDIVHPQDGVVTSIGEQHLESFGSVENIIKTKYELADALPEDGKLFLNISSETVQKNRPAHAAITYGLRPDADYFASDITLDECGTSFTLCHGEDRQRFTTSLLSDANVTNIVGAIAIAHEYGIPLSELVGAVRRLRPVPHRMELIDRGNLLIIDDAFNANPAGAKAALGTLSRFDAIRVIVTPGMIELGEKSDALNEALGKDAAAACDYIVAVGEKQSKPILRGAADAGFPKDRVYAAKSLADAMNFVYAIDAAGRKKVVLLENDLPDNF